MTYLEDAAAELRKAHADNERRFDSLPSLEAAKVPTLEIHAEVNARRLEIADGFIRLAAIEAGHVTEYDRRSVAEARKLVGVSGVEAVRALTGDEDDVMAWMVFATRLQYHLRDLLAIIDREIGDGDG